MGKRKYQAEPKPLEEWDVKDWEQAYAKLNLKLTKLKDKMRRAMNHISQAQNNLSESVL